MHGLQHRPTPVAAVSAAFVVIGVLLWVLWVAGVRVGALLLVGQLAISLGWLCAGATVRPRHPLAGVAAAALIYVVAGAVWLLLWNTVVRVRGELLLPAVSEPWQVIVTIFTWPWQLVTWTILDWLT